MESPDNVASQFQRLTTRSDPPTTDTTSPNRVVVFADMLGFAALTEANPIDLRLLHAHGHPLSVRPEDIFSTPKNPLTEAFSRFHYSLQWAITMAGMKHTITAITFSDSVFVATTYLFEATSFAIYLARSLLSQNIPVRMGIAFGSFAALRFRSDVSADGGYHAAQFLGTAVVRACAAERCGIKGMRIFLHPSVESLFSDATHRPDPPPVNTYPVRPLECPVAERANNARVCYELDYWDLATTKERSAWRGLQEMWASAPQSESEHYQATAEAINRMRMVQGEAPLSGLRRRTLPRRRK
jgi:hypothetical protein